MYDLTKPRAANCVKQFQSASNSKMLDKKNFEEDTVFCLNQQEEHKRLSQKDEPEIFNMNSLRTSRSFHSLTSPNPFTNLPATRVRRSFPLTRTGEREQIPWIFRQRNKSLSSIQKSFVLPCIKNSEVEGDGRINILHSNDNNDREHISSSIGYNKNHKNFRKTKDCDKEPKNNSECHQSFDNQMGEYLKSKNVHSTNEDKLEKNKESSNPHSNPHSKKVRHFVQVYKKKIFGFTSKQFEQYMNRKNVGHSRSCATSYAKNNSCLPLLPSPSREGDDSSVLHSVNNNIKEAKRSMLSYERNKDSYLTSDWNCTSRTCNVELFITSSMFADKKEFKVLAKSTVNLFYFL
jgi:hypothetical protein